MATKKAETGTSTAAPKARKARAATVKYFSALIHGKDKPVMVMAYSMKSALGAVVSVQEVKARDMVAAVRAGEEVIDKTEITVASAKTGAGIQAIPTLMS